jgi:hypothetical protein
MGIKDLIKRLQDSLEIYADYVNCLDKDFDTTEIIHMLIVRDEIEEILPLVPPKIVTAAHLKLIMLDNELLNNHRYVIEVVRGMGDAFGKPPSHWWWYLDAIQRINQWVSTENLTSAPS